MSPKKTPKRKNSGIEPSAESLIPLEEEAPDFPRGGASVLSKSEIDGARAEVDAKFKAEQRGPKKRKKTKQLNAFDDEVETIFKAGISGKLPKIVKSLRLKSLSTGMKLWGVIAEVNSKDLVISLPGGLRGIVTADEASDSLSELPSIMPRITQDVITKKKTLHGKEISESRNETGSLFLKDLFTVGQLVPCVVCKLECGEENGAIKDSRRIWLSLRLSLLHKGLTIDSVQDGMVMMACVKSVEDHGYVLSFGPPSFSGFLAHGDNKDGNNESKLKKGQLVQGVVSCIDRVTSVISMKINPMLVTNNMIKDHIGLSVDLLVPGTLVNARVQAILQNGLLLSFLTYFTGTVDIFHLQDPFPSSNWQETFPENASLKARILYIDPMTKAVGLTLNPHLIRNKVPPMGVKLGEIFDEAQVVRVDHGFGILVELPSKRVPTPGYVNITDASDDHLKTLEKRFKEGSKVRARVLGFRFTEGIAVATLKASVIEQSLFYYSDVKPGMVVQANVARMETSGAIVQLSNGLRAFCPLQHMSEFGAAKPSKKFQVGAKLQFRVLGCKSKRITVTHKKTLVTSKLEAITSYDDAVEGIITHGWIAGITSHGCFVKFYNAIKGYAHRSELGIDLGKEAESAFHIGQVVRCRVLRSDPAFRCLQLSFIISTDSSPQSVLDIASNVKIGNIVSGVVNEIKSNVVLLDVPMGEGSIRGAILSEHLSDNPGHSERIKSLLKPGYMFDRLLVLDIANQNLILSAKHSLIEFARFLPSEIDQLHPQSVLQGYISNIIDSGFFVRFLGDLTGFALKSKGSDNFSEELQCFYVGQSVRTHILKVNEETGKISLSLKQSSCFSTDASLLQGYFLEDDMIAKLHTFESGSTDINWTEDFVIGSCVVGEIQQLKEYGVIVNLREHKDIVGFITHHQLGGASVKIGNVVQARVLDIVKSDGIVDLTLRSELMQHSKLEESKQKPLTKKRRKSEKCVDLELHQKVNAVIELVKDNYLVLSLREHESAIGFASTHDFNMWMDPHKHFTAGQKVDATVEALPNASTSGRLLLLLSYFSDTRAISNLKRPKREVHHIGISPSYDSSVLDSKLAKSETNANIGSFHDLSTISESEQVERESHLKVGSLVEAEVFKIDPLEMQVKLGKDAWGRIHITELNDEFKEGRPLRQFKIGQKLIARIIERPQKFGRTDKDVWDLSVRPSALTVNGADAKSYWTAIPSFTAGEMVTAFVEKTTKEFVWLVVSRRLRGRMFILDSSFEPSELQSFQKRFIDGQAIVCRISNVDKKYGILDLTLRGLSSSHEAHHGDSETDTKADCKDGSCNQKFLNEIHKGDIVGGRIATILTGVGGLNVQVGIKEYGRVHFTELRDTFNKNPLEGYKEGDFVKCKVLDVTLTSHGKLHVDLSLRLSRGGCGAVDERDTNTIQIGFRGCSVEKIDDLRPGMEVQGYVKNISDTWGWFVMLSRHIDARVLPCNLSDTYIENPTEEFPVGKLVKGRILSVEPVSGRVDMTLNLKIGALQRVDLGLQDFHAEDIVSGIIIRRIENFGILVIIEHTNVVGLCHISELSDNYVHKIPTEYSIGDRVQVKILKVDEENKRISFGMKESYFVNKSVTGVVPYKESVEEGSEESPKKNSDVSSEDDDEGESKDLAIDILNSLELAREVESRASVPPLEVNFDTEAQVSRDAILEKRKHLDNDPSEMESKDDKKLTKRAKKKLKEKRELEIRAAEQKRLESGQAPDNVDEYEQLVRASPNSSFVWIKYMAFLLSIADVEKARAIAERALQTINFREEEEKLNVWVAFFNLENVYGIPPNEAVLKIFQRALQYCDPKKVHLALLGMYERTGQQEMAEQLLKAMTKKFKTSAKVWLRNMQNLLKQGSDAAEMVLNRALASLPRHKHIKFISRAAILEFKIGSAERARLLFEGVLRNYPKRTDLWSVYLDQEICRGDASVIRSLFERVTCLDLPAKKMKFLFKKYLDYEKSQGEESRIEYVKKKAMEFVNSKLG